ncbi:MAG: molybdate ABC transporter substrate-binding protein, partial [bacterium]
MPTNFNRYLTVVFAGVTTLIMMVTGGCGNVSDNPVHIAVASSLTDVMKSAKSRFEKEAFPPAVVSSAGSQTVARQIARGQKADIVALASTRWMNYLENNDRLKPGSRELFLSNSLVLIGGPNQNRENESITLLQQANNRVAMGNPESVPAGVYGRKTLENMGLWDSLSDRV